MYGKHFASMYTGSMYGAGVHVFAVWGYAIGNTDKDGFVEINPAVVAGALGNCEPSDVKAALQYLTADDPNSRSDKEKGARLVEEGPFLYRSVNFAEYRDMQKSEDRREYLRVKKRESRERIAEKARLAAEGEEVSDGKE